MCLPPPSALFNILVYFIASKFDCSEPSGEGRAARVGNAEELNSKEGDKREDSSLLNASHYIGGIK